MTNQTAELFEQADSAVTTLNNAEATEESVLNLSSQRILQFGNDDFLLDGLEDANEYGNPFLHTILMLSGVNNRTPQEVPRSISLKVSYSPKKPHRKRGSQRNKSKQPFTTTAF